MNRSHKIRIYPNREQEVQLKKTAGTARFAYNWAINRWSTDYAAYKAGESTVKPSAFGLMKTWTSEKPEWSREIACCAQQHAIANVGTAFKNFWRGNAKYPTFHKRSSGRASFYVDNAHACIKDNCVRLPNIGAVRMAEPLRYQGKILSYTVSCYANQWFVAVQVELNTDQRPHCANPDSVVGIDVGLKHVATASDGTVLDLPASLDKLDKKLRNAQKALARSQRNSRNREKRSIKKQRIQNKINNIRKDLTHKFTTAIAKNHGTVVVEDLNIQEAKDKATYRSFRHRFNESCMGEVLLQLEYKATVLRKADRYFPSTQLCSNCGNRKVNENKLKLSDRLYVCDVCGHTMDRDLNAAVNLMKLGLVKPDAPAETLLKQRQRSRKYDSRSRG